tara:strand:- start:244 stop:399 length:156 start_codon:yes stop_codon:yes gene_type:complete
MTTVAIMVMTRIGMETDMGMEIVITGTAVTGTTVTGTTINTTRTIPILYGA